MEIRNKNSQLDDGRILETVQLSSDLEQDLKAIRVNDIVTISFREFPEISREIEQSRLDDRSLTFQAKIFRERYKATVEKFIELQNNSGLEVIRFGNEISFVQVDIGLQKTLGKAEVHFLDNLGVCIFEIAAEVQKAVEDVRLDLVKLDYAGLKIDERGDDLTITIPGKDGANLQEIKIENTPSALISKKTKGIVQDLLEKYPFSEDIVALELSSIPMLAPEAARIDDVDADADADTDADADADTDTTAEHSFIEIVEAQLPQPTEVPLMILQETEVIPETTSAPSTSLEQITPAPPEDQMSNSHPQESATPATRIPVSKRLFQVVNPPSYQQPATEEESYKGTFGERIVRHRNERKLSEDALVQLIQDVVRKQNNVDGDKVVQWEDNTALPSNRTTFDALVKVLIDENALVPDEEKAKARRDLQTAHAEVRDYNRSSRDVFRSTAFGFGALVKKHRRQLDLSEDGLAKVISAKIKIVPDEDVDRLTYLDIALMQNNKRIPSKGLLQAMIRVFEKPGSDDLKFVQFDDEEKTLFIEAHEALVAERVSASSTAGYSESKSIPVSLEAKKLRADFLAMFTDRNGEEMSMAEIVDYSQKYSKGGAVNANDLANYMGSGRSVYVPMSDTKIESVRDILKVIYLEINGDPSNLDLLETKFNKLTEIFVQARQEQRQQMGGRVSPNGASTYSP